MEQQNPSSGGSSVVFRRQKADAELDQQQRQSNNKMNNSKKKGKSAGGGTSSVRNSWSFTTELPIQHHVAVVPIKENIYVDPETLINGNSAGDLKAVSRSRLRQRSVSNLNAAALAGTRSRDHSSSNRHHQNGTMAKGVDYIRIHPNPVRTAPLSVHQPAEMTVVLSDHQIQDRSEYGNPDGSSAHSTAERESGVVANNNGNKAEVIHPGMDLYQAINQNQANDYKIIQGYVIQPETADANSNNRVVESAALPAGQPPLVRSGSGRGSATKARAFPSSSSSTGKTSAEVHASRKPAAAVATSTGPNAVKTEWTFLPSPTAPTEPQHREINSKPEVCDPRPVDYFTFLSPLPSSSDNFPSMTYSTTTPAHYSSTQPDGY